MMDYETHQGPLAKGDVIVIEINGHLVQKSPTMKGKSNGQWFICLADQDGQKSVQLQPIDDRPGYAPRKYFVSSVNV